MSVNVFPALVVCCTTLPKANVEGEIEVARTPAPERVIERLLRAFPVSVILSVPGLLPVTVGTKRTEMAHVLLAGTTLLMHADVAL